jgi:hypothetical protein
MASTTTRPRSTEAVYIGSRGQDDTVYGPGGRWKRIDGRGPDSFMAQTWPENAALGYH